MKTKITYRVQTRVGPGHPWTGTYSNLESKRAVRRQLKYLVATLQWRIVEHRQTLKVIETRPWKKPAKKRETVCQRWPACGCIVRGSVRDCSDIPYKL